MTKFNRRRLLMSGLGAGVAGTTIAQSVQAQTSPRNSTPVKAPSTDENIDAIFGDDRSTSGTPRNQPTGSLSSTPNAYDRAISKLLIRCSQLGIQQFERGQQDPSYNGSIRVLEGYGREFDGYTQVATFTVTLDATTTLLPNLGNVGNRVIRRIITPTRAFIGFALTSETNNIIVFRGTSNLKEWIANFQSNQSKYVQGGVLRGQVHTGFLRLYSQLSEQVRRTANRFNPSLPCFVTGHSLGGALATLATADLAQSNRVLKEQLQLYKYGSPRVGDPSFAQFFGTIAPNSFRVTNFADMVSMVPPSNLREQQYTHVGQEWVFLDHRGDVSASHSTTVYQLAIDQQIETNQIPSFPTNCRSST